jgi:hypothetical protein
MTGLNSRCFSRIYDDLEAVPGELEPRLQNIDA